MDSLADTRGTIAVTCACGAYLEIDFGFAGQTVPCPDCQKPLEVPVPERKRTSGLAVASLLVALVGGLTLVGGVVAVVLGFLALRSIARHPKELAGGRVAYAGIVAGIVLFGAGFAALLWADRIGLAGWVREFAWRGKLENTDSLSVKPQKGGVELKRPDRSWGVYRLPEAQGGRPEEVFLVRPRDDAFVTAFAYWPNRAHEDLDNAREEACNALADSDLIKLLSPDHTRPAYKIRSTQPLTTDKGVERIEMIVDMTLAGQERTFLVRLARRERDDRIAVVAGCARSRRFARLEPQFKSIFDTVTLERD